MLFQAYVVSPKIGLIPELGWWSGGGFFIQTHCHTNQCKIVYKNKVRNEKISYLFFFMIAETINL